MSGNKRYPHVVRRPKGSRLPSISVAMGWREGTEGHGPTVSLATLRMHHGAVTRSRIESGGRQWAWESIYQTCRRGTCVWLVARNLYESLTVLKWWDRLDNGEWTICRQGKDGAGQIVHEDGCCFVIAQRRDGGRLVMVDARNYGVRELPGAGVLATEQAEALALWWADWLGWIAECDAGSLRLTLASQAHYCYKKRFMHHDILVHDDERALQLEQDAIHGGRCEAFRIGRLPAPVYHLDARSLYGYVAATNLCPAALVAYSEDGSIGRIGPGYDLCADVTVKVKEPIVPYRDTENGITVWPVGTFRTQLCGPELSLVWNNVVKVHRWSVYRMADLFGDWGRWCWERRQWEEEAGHATLAKQLKLWSQVCYGRWSQRYRGWRPDPDNHDLEGWELDWTWDHENKRPIARRSVAGRVEVYEDAGVSPGACPIITAWVNSLARVWLWKAMQAAGRENVHYVDTDSLFVSEAGMRRLRETSFPHGNSLGDLRTIARHAQTFIRGWKHYQCDGIVTCAGLRLSRRGQPIDQIEGERSEPLTVACAAGRNPVLAAPATQTPRVAPYRHGRIMPNGAVRPWQIEG